MRYEHYLILKNKSFEFQNILNRILHIKKANCSHVKNEKTDSTQSIFEKLS